MNRPTFVAAPPTPTQSTALVAAPVPRPRVRPEPRAEPQPPPGPAVLTYLRLHWLTILFCGALLGGALGYAAFSLVPVKYESFAELRVASNPFTVTSEADPQRGQTAFQVYIKTARIMMRSEPVLWSAVNDPVRKIEKLATLAGEPDAVKYLREKLIIETPEGSEIIRVSLEGEHAQDLKPIVDAVLDAFRREYLEREVTEKRTHKMNVEKLWLADRSELRKRQGLAETAQLEFQGLAPTPPRPSEVTAVLRIGPEGAAENLVRQASAVGGTPAGVAVGGKVLIDTPEMKKARAVALMGRLQGAETDLGKLAMAIPRADEQAKDSKAKADALAPAEPSAAALAHAAADPEVQQRRQTAERFENELRTAGTVNNPNSASIEWARRNAREARAAVESLRQEKASAVENQSFPARKAALTEAAARAADMAAQYRTAQADLKRGLAAMQAELAGIRVPEDALQGEEKRTVIDPALAELMTRSQAHDALTRRTIDLDYDITAPSRVTLPRGGASVSREKDGKKPLMAALAATLAGFGLVAGLLVANEIRTRKVSALGELAGTGVKVLGVVPFSPDSADPVKRGDIAEAIHKLRAAVAQEWLGRGPATVLVTSPLGDEGKAFCAFRLATSLAQAGARTLLVDFDLRAPAIHVFAGIPNTAGVADVLRGEADARANQVILPSGLVVLPAGEWAPESSGDAIGQYPSLGAALDPLLHRLRSDVDVLVVHGHAILTAADSLELARRSDAVLLCASYRETRVPLLKRAAERVAGMAGPTAAVVYLGATRQEALC